MRTDVPVTVILAGRFEWFYRDPTIYVNPMVGDFCRVRR